MLADYPSTFTVPPDVAVLVCVSAAVGAAVCACAR